VNISCRDISGNRPIGKASLCGYCFEFAELSDYEIAPLLRSAVSLKHLTGVGGGDVNDIADTDC
jgi:hypothetical protein